MRWYMRSDASDAGIKSSDKKLHLPVSVGCNYLSLPLIPESVTALLIWNLAITLRWRHNEHDSVSNHQPHHCLLNRLFRRRSKKTSKHRVTGLCAGNSPGTGEFSAQMASNAENVSIWWRHHDHGAVCKISLHVSFIINDFKYVSSVQTTWWKHSDVISRGVARVKPLCVYLEHNAPVGS